MKVKTLALSLLAGAVLLAAPGGARAAESRRLGSFELGAGNYTPDIDAEFAAPGPYEEMFGRGRGPLFRFGLSRALFTGFGSLEVGLATGYFRRSGEALINSGTPEAPVWERSGDKTTFNVIPTSLTLTYRFDWLATRYPVPLAPYGRVSLERYNWWVSDAEGLVEKGATNGWSMTGGLAIYLNFFDRGLARELDADTGINHTFLYVDVTRSFVDDFGAKDSWDLSGKELMFSGGLLFAF